jgi:hypothetical protein
VENTPDEFISVRGTLPFVEIGPLDKYVKMTVLSLYRGRYQAYFGIAVALVC